jgi:hypothetical protein
MGYEIFNLLIERLGPIPFRCLAALGINSSKGHSQFDVLMEWMEYRRLLHPQRNDGGVMQCLVSLGLG